jgi:hypothetical protein
MPAVAGAAPAEGMPTAAATKCRHYERRCEVQAPCCGGWFGCHLCHDEQVLCFPAQLVFGPWQDGSGAPRTVGRVAKTEPTTPPPAPQFVNDVSVGCAVEMKGSSTDAGRPGRYLVARVRCTSCQLEQAAEGRHCAGCGVEFAEYVCVPCRLYAAPGAPRSLGHSVARSLAGRNWQHRARPGTVRAGASVPCTRGGGGQGKPEYSTATRVASAGPAGQKTSSTAAPVVPVALDLYSHSHTTLYIPLVVLHTKYTGWRQNNFNVHA